MSHPNFEVSRATQADVAAIAPLFDAYRQFYQQSGDLQRAFSFLADRLGNAESVIFFCHPRGDRTSVAGFTQLYPIFSSVSVARVWVLNDLFVAASARRSGIARLLLSAADQHARETGAIGIQLETQHTNVGAQALYKSFGYEQANDTQHYWRRIEPNGQPPPASA